MFRVAFSNCSFNVGENEAIICSKEESAEYIAVCMPALLIAINDCG